MQTRTRLTTAPGEEPAPPPSADTGVHPDGDHAYVPGFALPTEPRPPGRYRRLVIALVVLTVLAIAGYVVLQIVTAGEDFDPAVGDNPDAPATELPDGGETTG